MEHVLLKILAEWLRREDAADALLDCECWEGT